MVSLFRPFFDTLIPEAIHNESIELQRQYTVIATLIIISCIFLITLGIITSLQGAQILSILDFTIAATFVGLGIFMKETGRIKLVGTLIISFFALYFYYLFYYGGLERSTWVWYFTFPLWSIFILGKHKGGIISFLLMAVTVATYLFVINVTHEPFYSMNMMIRFILSYLCVVLITYMMEDTRVELYRKLVHSNTELRQTVEELSKTQGMLHASITRDAVTDLYNERHFNEILKLSIAHANRFGGSISLLFIEIDYSTNYINRYGADSFDKAVKKIAETLSTHFAHDADTLCRIGDNRFAAILMNTAPEHVDALSSQISNHFNTHPLNHERSPYRHITLSIGAVHVPASQEIDSCRILAQAEAVLGRVIEKGRNTYATSLA